MGTCIRQSKHLCKYKIFFKKTLNAWGIGGCVKGKPSPHYLGICFHRKPTPGSLPTLEGDTTMIGWCYLSSETHLQGRRSKYLTASIAWALTVRKGEGAGRAFQGCSLKARLPTWPALPAVPTSPTSLPAEPLPIVLGVCLFLPDSASRALTHTPWPSSLPDCFIHNGYKYPPASKHQLNQVCHSTDALGASLCAQPHVGWRCTLLSSENILGWETQGDQET